MDLLTVALSLIFAYLTYVCVKFFSQIKASSGIAAVQCLFSPFSIPGLVLPWGSAWNPGLTYSWTGKSELYRDSDTVALISFFPAEPLLFSKSVHVLRQLGNIKAGFQKNFLSNKSFLLWGKNLFTENGDDWKRHKRVVAPAFNTKTYELVWSETARSYHSLFSDPRVVSQHQLSVPSINEHISKVALFVVSAAAFGVQLDWDEPPTASDGTMSIQEALKLTGDTIIIRLTCPRWAYWLPIKSLHNIDRAYSTLTKFMREQVASRKADIHEGGHSDKGHDIFSRLVAASESEGGKSALNDSELIGNTFLMLMAGHDTTSSTISGTCALLASHQDEQEKVYQQIQSVLQGNREPTLSDFESLDKVLCSFLEALRLFPPGYLLIREASEDTIIKVSNTHTGAKNDHIVRKGTMMMGDMIGYCYDPTIFSSPNEFRPSRWSDPSARSEFLAFSSGPRMCVGHRFAQIEGVCFLTLLLQQFKLDVELENGESLGDWRKRFLKDISFTGALEVKSVSLKLTRRL